MNRVFGRIKHFDDRSRQFPIRSLIPASAKPRSYTWACAVNLDQGQTSACTGFSVSQEAAAKPVIVPGITNAIGLKVYRLAKKLDDYPGEDYDGSSVLGAMKAGVKMGWYKSYRWAFGEPDLRLAISYCGPAVLGISWYDGMSDPDKQGIIKPTGQFLGGHAILCNGFNVRTGLYRLHNSWGTGWGKKGDCFVSIEDMAYLLNDEGEACIPTERVMPGK